MGFLDKLLGRGKDAAETTGEAAKDVGSTAAGAASDVADKAGEAAGEAKSRISGDDESESSELTRDEQRLDNVRDQNLRNQGRMP